MQQIVMFLKKFDKLVTKVNSNLSWINTNLSKINATDTTVQGTGGLVTKTQCDSDKQNLEKMLLIKEC